ncbi:MAG TPA: UDP-N-acetylmuramoylalanyl-D-glutamyl-2,6-diaminopimelate--D-alanyl-D-alanine ligase [Aliidongia sp.]|nr:UDP-N-acetylmuramoylalanyl-D-glutamyl-2,6-diaminopimelate--D-alanyl-D-alanine ligase [Aliidongia sp.]
MRETPTPLWTPAELVGAVDGAVVGPPPSAATGVSIDSRTLEQGDLFVALVGPRVDGHAHITEALARGAAGAVVARLPGDLPEHAPLVQVDDTQSALEKLGDAARRRSTARILAVTGSVGKTGTKEMLATALAPQGRTHRSLASYNNHWGVPLSLARMPREARFGVFELGMNQPGEIAARTRQVRPDIAIITTVEPAHLEFFEGIEGIADAKAEIFLGMTGQGTAILNRDNPMFDRLAAAAKERGLSRIVGFGAHESADVRLLEAALQPDRTSIKARVHGRDFVYRLGQPGRHLAMNSLAVIAAVAALDADLDLAAEALANFEGLAGRGRQAPIAVAGGEARLIDESYNASPASMRAAFAVLSYAGARRRIAVLGDMRELGAEAPALHKALAEPIEAAGIDLVFAAGPLMRHLFDALPESRRGGWAESAADLAAAVLSALAPGDVITVKGSLGSRMADIVKPLLAGDAAANRTRS